MIYGKMIHGLPLKYRGLLRFIWIIVLALIFWQATTPIPFDVLTMENDKLGHVLTFAFLGVWALICWTDFNLQMILIGFLAFYGILIEFVQYFVPGRYFSLVDWAMDILGLIIAGLLIKLGRTSAMDIDWR